MMPHFIFPHDTLHIYISMYIVPNFEKVIQGHKHKCWRIIVDTDPITTSLNVRLAYFLATLMLHSAFLENTLAI